MNKTIIPLLIIANLFILPVTGSAQSYSLSQCEEMAIANNHRIRNSKLDIESAIQTRKEAFTNYFPTVHGVGSYFNVNQGLMKTNIEPQNYLSPELQQMLPSEILGILPSSIPISLLKNGIVGGVTATQPIFAGGRIVSGNKLARIGENVSRMQLDLTEKDVVLQTHTYFWQIVNLREKLQTIEAVETLLNNLHTDVETAVRAGMTTRNDLLRVELQMHETQSDRLTVENNLEISKMALAQFIGAAEEGFDILYDGSEEFLSPEMYYTNALEAAYGRTESKLLDQSIHAAKLKTRISQGEHLPSVAVGGGYLYNDLMGKANNSGVIYATVSVPISDWWGGSHAKKRHKFAEQQARNEKQNGIELMAVEINQTWNNLIEAHKQILLAEQSIKSSTENLRIVNNCYNAGTVRLTDVLDAQVLFQQSKDMRAKAFCQYQTKLIKYLQITAP